MPRPTRYTFAPANATTNDLGTGLTGAGPWVPGVGAILLGGVVPGGLAHQLVIVASTDIADTTLTLTGTDADGKVITDALAIVNTTPVESVKYFKTLTSISASVSLGANSFSVGHVDEFVSPTTPLRWQEGDAPAHFYHDVTGTANYDIEFTNSDLSDNVTYPAQNNRPWFIVSASLDDETADGYVEVNSGLTGWRLKVNSYTDTATIAINVSQADSNQKFN